MLFIDDIPNISNAEKNKLQYLFDKARNAPRPCFALECRKHAKGSHLLQLNGVLNKLASGNGKIVQFSPASLFLPMRFEYRGLSQANSMFLFPGFCKKHDDEIFSVIEKTKCKFNKNEHFLLLFYRTILFEVYKREFISHFYRLIIHDNDIRNEIQRRAMDKIINYNLGTVLVNYVRYCVERQMNDAYYPPYFNFIRFELPSLGVSSCTIQAYATIENERPAPGNEHLSFEEHIKYNILNSKSLQRGSIVFTCLIPYQSSSLLVIGYSNNIKVINNILIEDIIGFDNLKLIKLASDLLMTGNEQLFVSPEIYENWKRQGKDQEILRLKETAAHLTLPFFLRAFNIFS